MTIDEMRRLPLETFLQRLGHSPTVQKRHDLWYNAPYREERTPSFKVNTDRNVWFDFGLGRGGDIFTLPESLQAARIFSRRRNTSRRRWVGISCRFLFLAL